MIEMHDIGKRIRDFRIQQNMTQQELADKCGYKSKVSINKIELQRDLPIKKIIPIANALGVEPTVLMGWKEPEETPAIDLAAELLKESDPILIELAEVYSKLTPENRLQLLKIAKALLQ